MEMFGSRGVLPNSALPTRLGKFYSALCTSSEADSHVGAIIFDHTLLPYFTFYGARGQMAKTANAMVGHNFPKATAGLLAGAFGASDVLRYCPICAALDRDQYGLAYWHRSHQLPQVSVCALHCVALIGCQSSRELRSRHALPLPPQVFEPSRPLGISNSSDSSHKVRFAISSALLMRVDQSNLNPKAISASYRDRLICRGLARKSGRIDQIALRSELCSYYQDFQFLPDGDLLRARDGQLHWLERIVRTPRTRQHPVLHLLVTNFLFSDPQELARFVNMGRTKTSSVGVDEFSAHDTLVLKWISERKMSLRAIAKTTGKSVTTLKVQALSAGLKVDRRPKYISDEMEAAILSALIEGETVESIAKSFHTSVVSVYRILRSNPKCKEQRAKLFFEAEVKKRRERFMSKLETAPGNKRINAREAAREDYVWLWRHDRAWLAKILRNREKSKPCATRRVDWQERDAHLLKRVQEAIAQIMMLSGKPRRLTLNEIGRRIGKISMLQKSLRKLPKTAALIAKTLETTYDFQIRRVNWAITRHSGSYVGISAIARAAGVSDMGLVRRVVEERLSAKYMSA